MSKPFILGGTLVEAGEISEIHLPLTEASNSRPVFIPIIVIRGEKEGPTLLLTAAVHGDELNGTAILRYLVDRVSPKKLRGTLVIAPIVNILGYLSLSRYLPDHRDLNRFFPGSHKGNMAERIAYRFFEDVVKQADFGIDFHAAISGRENFPHVRGDMKNPAVRKYARAFGTAIVVDDRGVRGMLRLAATKAGIPFFAFEGGTSNTFQKSIVRTGVTGVLTFMHRVGMLERRQKLPRSPFRIIVRKTEWIRAERGGLLELQTHPGGLVYRGDPIAKVSNPWGRDVHMVPSPITGIVIGVTTSPVVNPGTAVANVAKLRKTLSTVERYVVAGTLKSEL